MDHLSTQLMKEIVLEPREGLKPNSLNKKNTHSISKNANSKSNNDYTQTKTNTASTMPKEVASPMNSVKRSLKIEMQTLILSEYSEKQLYDTLKQIYGSSFKLAETFDFENKNSNLGRQFWLQRGNLIIKSVMDYSSKDTNPKTHHEITRQFAVSKLETYNFNLSHCIEALTHTDGDMGKALELLFSKYYKIDSLSKNENLDSVDMSDLIERRQEEKEALQSIYEDTFTEKIKNQIWTFDMKLNYLIQTNDDEVIKNKPKVLLKDICRLYLAGKCKFGIKCRFVHQQPEPEEKPRPKKDAHFTLEIRFPDNSKYPYEPPYFFFYKPDGLYPPLNCLRIVRLLYNEALTHCKAGIPCIFTIVSLLENENYIKSYLEENKEFFLDPNDSLFPKLSKISNDGPSRYKKGSSNKKIRDEITMEDIFKQDIEIKNKFMKKQRSPQYLKMKEARKNLPAWSKMNEVLEKIHENQIVIVSGETGCGKSTQVPQFILDDWLINMSEESKQHVEIVCTEPRRISAIAVAERVAAERDERVGNTVGYQIRLESKVSNNTRLTFCTTGILLQRLTSDPILKSVTHVIVDEIHERSAESDLLLMLLKKILSERSNLKIILMSATLKADIFSTYFGKTPIINIPGRTYPVTQLFLEDILEESKYVVEENSKYSRNKGSWEQLYTDALMAHQRNSWEVLPKNTILDENLTVAQIIRRYSGYSNLTHQNLYVMNHEAINYDLIEHILEWLNYGNHDYPKHGTILVFLPGITEIMTLKNILCNSSLFSPEKGKFVIIPLHSTLTSEEQSSVFKRPEHGVRKIVLSTNIAETSITIDDCVIVIDTGKMKETRFDSNKNMESLELCWVSRANALQRMGRSGRVGPGVCIHLYTSHRFKYNFLAHPISEIQRISLEPLLLRIKILNKDHNVDLHKALGQLIESPADDSISTAIKRLQNVGAFDPEGMLTPLGHHLAALPVDVRIGKLILFGAIFCCVDSALTIAACLSHKSPFVTPFDKRNEVDIKKKEFSVAHSDQLTTLKAYKKYMEVSARGYHAGQAFANENFLSIKTLQTIADIKHQFLELLVSIGFVPIDLKKRSTGQDKILEITGQELNANNENYNLLQGLLCAALYPNIVRVFTPEKSFVKMTTGAIARQPKPEELRFQTQDNRYVNIHPSSINSSVGYYSSPYLVFQEKIKTSRTFIREVTMVPILSLALFSGYGIDIELHNGTFILSLGDGWITIAVESHRTGQLLQYARIELEKLLLQKMEDPLLNIVNHANGRKIITTIVNIITRG